jgi:hypothetical protein
MLSSIFRDYVEPLFFAIGVLCSFAKVYDAVHGRYMEYRGRKLWEKIKEQEKGTGKNRHEI